MWTQCRNPVSNYSNDKCVTKQQASTIEKNAEDHTAGLIVGAFFFAMQSGEYVIPGVLGRTVTICLAGVKLFDATRQEVNHNHRQ